MKMLLHIHLNDKLWIEKERHDILLRALAIYEEKRCCNKLDTSSSSKYDNESENDMEVVQDDDYISSSNEE